MAMTPPGRHTGISVEILGSPRVRREDGTDWKPPQLLADLLVTLALAGADGRSREWLRRVLWSQLPSTDANPVVQAVQRLRKHVPIPKPAPGGPYVLDVPAERIDALAFCRGVAELAPDGGRSGPTGATGAAGPDELARVDGLLGMWRGSPWARDSRLPESAWNDVRRARDRLVARVRALPADEQAGLAHWNRFREHFHGEPGTGRPVAPAARREPRKRVLIVDDMIGHALAVALDGTYDCEVVGSLAAWKQLLGQEPPLDYACALVDRHLSERTADCGGEIVLRDLRRLRPALPTALMSVDLPYEDSESLRERLGARAVIPKHNDAHESLVPLVDLVEKLIARGQSD
ncbi:MULTISPECIES: response regulator transcription factor [Streptomyces]|uniref:response regulator transcription factor n=1 Tax=Streptomyces TaxID=1883 RepID=UPI0011F2B08B|nr:MULTISPECIES: response regulator transcription factor [Streptomyces]QHF93496.1 hypothetical protein DEH18_05965 [Streptomyces sp. NHF165]